MDPLSLIHAAFKQDADLANIVIENDEISVNNTWFKLDAPTAFIVGHGPKKNSFYKLSAVYAVLKYGPKGPVEYSRKCMEKKWDKFHVLDERLFRRLMNEETLKHAQIATGNDVPKATQVRTNLPDNQGPRSKKHKSTHPLSESQSSTSNTQSAAIQNAASSDAPVLPAPTADVPETSVDAFQEVLKRERTGRNRTTILHSNSKSFQGVLDIFAAAMRQEQLREREQKRAPSSKDGHKRDKRTRGDKSGSRRSERSGLSSHKHKPEGKPIIVVPSSMMNSVLTSANAEKLLGQGIFVNSLEARKSSTNKVTMIKRPEAATGTTVPHDGSRKGPCKMPTEFELVENVKRLTHSEDWARVVAVFASGQEWQFKGWRWNTPVQVFSNTCGFHIYFNDNTVPPIVRTWNVCRLPINKNKRHFDKPAMLDFWRHLDKWLLLNKPELCE